MIARHDERLDGRAAPGLVQRRPHHDVGGPRPGGDVDLLAVDDVLIAVEHRRRRDRRRIRTEGRFGDRHRSPDAPAKVLQLLIGGHPGDSRITQALTGHRQQQCDITPGNLKSIEESGHVGAVDISLRSVPPAAECVGAGEGFVGFRECFEQGGQGVEFDRVSVLVEVVLARDGPQHSGGTLVGEVDHGLQLARHLQIDCHQSTTTPSATPTARRSRYQRSTGCSLV